MKVQSRWSKVVPVGRVERCKSKVNSAGYVPVAKRIEGMVQAGLAFQAHSLYQSDDPRGIVGEPVNARHDIHEDLTAKREEVLQARAYIDAAEKARLEALKASAVSEYLSAHPELAKVPSGASGEVSKEAVKEAVHA